MDFEKKLKMRIVKMVLILVIGIAALTVGTIIKLSAGLDDFSAGYLTGTGGGLIVISIVLIARNAIALKNKDKQKLMRIEEQDERNLYLAYKSGYYSMITTAVIVYTASFYLAFTDPQTLRIMTSIISLLFFSYLIVFLYLKRVK
jgi:hypothetical protein